MNLYLDIQNIYNNKATTAPVVLLQRDSNGNPIEDPTDSSRYLLKTIPNTSGILQPSIGILLVFKVKGKTKK